MNIRLFSYYYYYFIFITFYRENYKLKKFPAIFTTERALVIYNNIKLKGLMVN